MKKVTLFVLCYLLVFNTLSKAQKNDEEKANWIIQNFATNVSWKNENKFDSFSIGVLGKSTDVYNQLVKLSKYSKIKDLKFTVLWFNGITDISPTNILYVEPGFNKNLQEVYNSIGFNTLLITDKSESTSYTMINFLDAEKSNKKFEINIKNAEEYGVTFNNNLILHGGNEAVLRLLYMKTLKELDKEKQIRAQIEAERNSLYDTIARLKKINK
jgi:hypothetical protein